MTDKKLKEYEREVASMQDERLAEFHQRVELSELDGASKRELLKYIDARREVLADRQSLFAEHSEVKDGDLD